MAAVYSTRFFMQHAAGGGIYTVPAGYTAVVRDIDIFYSGGVGSYVNVINPVYGTFAYAAFGASVDGALISWRGRQVFQAGEAIEWACTDDVDLMASGYLLALP